MHEVLEQATRHSGHGLRSQRQPEIRNRASGVPAIAAPFCIKTSSCPNLKHLSVWKELRYTGVVGATRRFHPYSSCCP